MSITHSGKHFGKYLAAAGFALCSSAMAASSIPVQVQGTEKLKQEIAKPFKAPSRVANSAWEQYQAPAQKSPQTPTIVISPTAAAATTTPSALSAQKSASATSSLARTLATTSEDATFTPLCQTLAVNTNYTLNGALTGDFFCYHFEITTRSKTTVYLINQSTGTDMFLALMKDDGQNNLTALQYSDYAGDADEAVIELTEPGHYYWFMEANAAENSSFNFGAITNTVIDAYELNDTVSRAYPLPDGLNRIAANSDNDNDSDFYAFTATHGQDVLIWQEGLNGAPDDHWLLDYSIDGGNNWLSLDTGLRHTITPSQPTETIIARVKPNSANLPIISQVYRLVFGSKISTSLESVTGENTVLRIPNAAPTAYGYMTTQAYREVNWNTHVSDSTGAGIPNIRVVFRLDQRENNGELEFNEETDHYLVTDSSGAASETITLDRCYEDYTTEFQNNSQGYTNTWRTTYDVGGWRLEYPDLQDLEMGIGGDISKHVTFGHLCTQTLRSSVKS